MESQAKLITVGSAWNPGFHGTLPAVTAVKKYHIVQEDLAALLGRDLLLRPEGFFDHVRLTAGRIVLAVAYGLPAKSADNEYIMQAEETMHVINEATTPGRHLCDFFPFLKHLPSWLQFQKEAKEGKAMVEILVTRPYEHVKRRMAAGTAVPSLTQDLLCTKVEDIPNLEHRVKWTTGALYGTGSETTYGTVLIFMLAMALYPEKQQLAQDEIDRVIGTERMPTLADRPNLPYIEAVMKETLRWHPIVPLSLGRRTSQDDVYEGYFIPEGTIVLPNAWALAFEPNEKYDTQAFIPERFLDVKQPTIDPTTYVFGFGRRICPGRFLGEESIFILICTILAVFDIAPRPDEELRPCFTKNLISLTEPFKCCITPRSDARVQLIEDRAAAAMC